MQTVADARSISQVANINYLNKKAEEARASAEAHTNQALMPNYGNPYTAFSLALRHRKLRERLKRFKRDLMRIHLKDETEMYKLSEWYYADFMKQIGYSHNTRASELERPLLNADAKWLLKEYGRTICQIFWVNKGTRGLTPVQFKTLQMIWSNL